MKRYSENSNESKSAVYPKLYKSKAETGRQNEQSFQQEK
jgi:hypothetical protein